MRRLLTILLFAVSLKASAFTAEKMLKLRALYFQLEPGESPWFTSYTLTPADGYGQNGHSNGYLVINGDPAHHTVAGSNVNIQFVPGDVLSLHSGQYWAVELDWVNGAFGNPVTIQNWPGETVYVGDQAWGTTYFSWGFCVKFLNCHQFKFSGTSFGQLHLTGSTTGGFSASGANQSFSDLVVGLFSDHAEVANLWIREGGHGIWCKTEVDPSNARTWFSSGTKPTGFNFHDNRIDSTADEAMYLGHTATFWNKTSNVPYYPTDTNDNTARADTNTYKQPIKYDSFHVHHNLVVNVRIDGIQCAALDHLEVDNNEVNSWAYVRIGNPQAVDIAGILDGGRCTNVYIHDNIVHDGYGDIFQLFGEGWNQTITNNLGYNTPYGEGVSIRSTAGTLPGVYQFNNNTISQVGSHTIRINNAFGTRGPVIINACLLIQPAGQYIYKENGGNATEGAGSNANSKFATLAAANVNTSCYYRPNNINELAGYRNASTCGSSPVIPLHKIYRTRTKRKTS